MTTKSSYERMRWTIEECGAFDAVQRKWYTEQSPQNERKSDYFYDFSILAIYSVLVR